MSFIIAVHVNEGIVLASDRRVTYTSTSKMEDGTIVRNIGLHTTDSTEKTFLCPNGCGISTCGDASLEGKPITGYIQEFVRSMVLGDTGVSEIPQKLITFFGQFAKKPNTTFIVAGYEKDGTSSRQVIYRVYLDSSTIEKINTDAQGATWNGEINTLVRLIQNVAIRNEDGTYSDLPNEEILWNFFTLQDAVDFARYAVETTINTMRFKNVIETVGGSIDILVITPDEAKWLQKSGIR